MHSRVWSGSQGQSAIVLKCKQILKIYDGLKFYYFKKYAITNKDVLYSIGYCTFVQIHINIFFFGFFSTIGYWSIEYSTLCFPDTLLVKKPPANTWDIRDSGSIPGWGRSPGGGHGKPLQHSCLENPMDRGAWRAVVHGVAHSRIRLSNLACLHAYTHTYKWITLPYALN